MTPFHIAMQVSQTMFSAVVSAQKTWAETTLNGFDAMTRIHEKPEDAADRARANATRGTSKSWYRPPAARMSDLSAGYASAAMAPWQAFGAAFPMAMTGSASPLGMFAPAMTGMMAPFSMPTLFGAAPGGPFVPPQTQASNGIGPAGSVSRSRPRDGVTDEAAAQQNEAVASITMPDNTVYKITIPMNAPLPFWPWAGGFGAVPYAQAPLTIEADAQSTGSGSSDDEAR